MSRRLSQSFFIRPTVDVARDLLGKIVCRALQGHVLTGRIVEVEAYTGGCDPGSHAFRGPTPRTAVMFGPAGKLYVYFTYGMHYCINIVTEAPGNAGAVLLRSLEPLSGIEIMMNNRRGMPVGQLCNGPAKLCQALCVTRADNGADASGDTIWIENDGYRAQEIITTTRVGLSAGMDLPLRFYLAGNRFVSPGKPSGVVRKKHA